MRAVVTRVKHASVTIEGAVTGWRRLIRRKPP